MSNTKGGIPVPWVASDSENAYFRDRHVEKSKEHHPDIIKLYDDIEEQLFGQFRAWGLFEEKDEDELREVLRGYLVSVIGKIFKHSPYWNKEHPMYAEGELAIGHRTDCPKCLK